MKERERLLADRPRYESKAVGCLAGLAVGDAMGDVGRNQEFRTRYGLVTGLAAEVAGTDDTEFSILTARALLDAKGDLKPQDVAAAWRKYVLDRGGARKRAGRPLYGALENLRRGLQPPQSGLFNAMNDDDGAAMRVAPLGLYRAGDPEGAARLAEADACVSHDGDGIWAARAVAASVAVATADGSVGEIVEAGLRQLPAGSWMKYAMDAAMGICSRHSRIEDAYEEMHDTLRSAEHCASAEAVPQAYAVFRMTGGDFRAGLFWSANFGRDADTIAAIVCAFSGALHGTAAVPDAWVERVRRAAGVCLEFARDEDIVQLARRIVGLSYGEGV